MVGSFSLIQYEVNNFHSILMSSRPFFPTTTLLLKLVSALIHSEPDPDPKMKERIAWLYENTHEKVKEHISIIEYITFNNIGKGVNREVEVGSKAFYLYELYRYLDDITHELILCVVAISKKYNLEIPIQHFGSGQKIDLTQ